MRVQDPPGRGYHPGIDSDDEDELNRSWLRRHGAAIFLACLLVFGGVTILVEVGPKGLLGFSPQSKPTVVNPRQAEFEGVMQVRTELSILASPVPDDQAKAAYQGRMCLW